MVTLEEFGLERNPFPLEPEAMVQNWAGRQEIRQHLLDIIDSALITDVGMSEFVVLHGDYGAGKSHALRYLKTRIEKTESEKYKARAVYLATVNLDQKITFLRLYREIISEIGDSGIRHLATGLRLMYDNAKEIVRNRLTPDELRELTQDTAQLDNRILDQVPREDKPLFQLMLQIATGGETAAKGLDFLRGGKTTFSGIDLANPIDSDFMAVKTLGSLFRVMTLSLEEQEPVHRAAYLFVDEVEALIEMKAAEATSFVQAFRELVNQLPYRFCLLLALSADAALLEAVMGEALIERMTRPYLQLPALDVDEAVDFVAAQLSQFRPDGYSNENPFYPFEQASVELSFEQIPELTPRRIFRTLRTVLERAIRRENLQPGESITPELTQNILESTTW